MILFLQQKRYLERNDMKPAMTPDEQYLLRLFFNKARNYLEFGSGGSTCIACEIIPGTITSIESAQVWIEKVKAAVPQSAADRLQMIRVDIGPVKNLGYPADETHRNLWANYHTNVWEKLGDTRADTVLVDGRFRIACFVQTLLHTPMDTVVLVHDFSNREYYKPMRQVGREILKADNLSAFVRRSDFDPVKARAVLEQHIFDPR
jgi:hypothetical protein